MQYFLGYSSFTTVSPFDPSLFVSFRKMLGIESINAINERIVAIKTRLESTKEGGKTDDNDHGPTGEIVNASPSGTTGTIGNTNQATPTDVIVTSPVKENRAE